MASINLSTFNPLLKRIQEGPVQETFNSDDSLLSRIPKTDDAEGVDWKAAVRTGRIGGFGCQDPEAAQPTPQAATYGNPVLQYKDFLARPRVSHAVIKRAKSQRGSYARPIAQAIKETTMDSADDWVRMFLNDGSGTLTYTSSATAGGAAGADYFVAEDFFVHTGTSGTNIANKEDLRKFQTASAAAGTPTPYSIWDLNNPSAAAELAVNTSVTGYTNGFTVKLLGSGAASRITIWEDIIAAETTFDTAGGFITKRGARTRTLSYEFMGLGGIASDLDPPMNQTGAGDQVGLNGLDVATYPTWKAYVSKTNTWTTGITGEGTGTVRPITTRLLQEVKDGIWNAGKGKPSLIITTSGVRTEMAESQLLFRRNINTTKISGETGAGFTENRESNDLLEWAGIPIWPDKYAPKYQLLMVDMDYIDLRRVSKPEFVSEDGSMIRLSTDGTLAWEMTLYFAGNLATTHRAAHGKLMDIFEPT